MAIVALFIQEAQGRDVETIHRLAHKIWPITFKAILAPAQIDYMLDKMYSVESLRSQQREGCDLYLLKKASEDMGYLSLQHNISGTGKTKIHKIYVLPSIHGTGAGRFLIDHAFAKAQQQKSNAIYLNVNRHNQAIGFYEHCGFKKMYPEDIDIGQGYLMEDWVMEKNLQIS